MVAGQLAGGWRMAAGEARGESGGAEAIAAADVELSGEFSASADIGEASIPPSFTRQRSTWNSQRSYCALGGGDQSDHSSGELEDDEPFQQEPTVSEDDASELSHPRLARRRDRGSRNFRKSPTASGGSRSDLSIEN